jgi:hypothetical protein
MKAEPFMTLNNIECVSVGCELAERAGLAFGHIHFTLIVFGGTKRIAIGMEPDALEALADTLKEKAVAARLALRAFSNVTAA